jgi:hypothetical protein
MPAFQNIAGLPVIKIDLAVFPMNQCEAQAVVLAVAGCAHFARRRCMKPAPLLQALANGGVAFQAFRIVELLTDLMAAQTLGQTFKLCVCLRERAW